MCLMFHWVTTNALQYYSDITIRWTGRTVNKSLILVKININKITFSKREVMAQQL